MTLYLLRMDSWGTNGSISLLRRSMLSKLSATPEISESVSTTKIKEAKNDSTSLNTYSNSGIYLLVLEKIDLAVANNNIPTLILCKQSPTDK